MVICRFGENGSHVHVDMFPKRQFIVRVAITYTPSPFSGVVLASTNIKSLLRDLDNLRVAGYIVPHVIERRVKDKNPGDPAFLLFALTNFVKVILKI